MSTEIAAIVIAGGLNLAAIAFGAGRMSARLGALDARLSRMEGFFDRFFRRGVRE